MQRFDTRKYSVSDFLEWKERDELELQPKFQRRNVWNDKARSYLIDTIVRGKPIPKLYIRQATNPKSRKTVREVVDGQQRLRTVFMYLLDGFPIYKSHNEEYAGKRFSQLEEDLQKEILKYEFAVDLLQDMPDQDVYDVFARLNTYAVKLSNQELRHAKYFGDFRTLAYRLANEYNTFWQTSQILTDREILRMADAELVSDLVLQMLEGITERSKGILDKAYGKYDENLPRQDTLTRQFRETMDTIGAIFKDDLPSSHLSGSRLFMPFFASIFHMKFGIKGLDCARSRFKEGDLTRLRVALDSVDDVIEKAEQGDELSNVDKQFCAAYQQHWVHRENRRVMALYICKLLNDALAN